ncbi:DUF4269 domain-containing protein [Dyadobacter sp. NIV53]|uniref:DUF4269 domain-containing protein n=1 Tax=Dyadobacter sp. NIV53 TaxID=2861765 RepID=UPI001C86C9D1|nr:DUF4269 domain-containing protein [Dyadobacter sp. NIV53]
MTNFDNIEYLKLGNEKQHLAYEVLAKNRIFHLLEEFDPVLAGTIPIQIDIENSDLDILCYWSDKQYFIKTIKQVFSSKNDFQIRENDTLNAVISTFEIGEFEIEIFGQNIPTRQQNGYRHMIVEHHLLRKLGEAFRLKIIELKKQGYKTEPAFALALKLDGDPYSELLKFESELPSKS